jgi:phenylalanyl-tRNA synthetase beta chain
MLENIVQTLKLNKLKHMHECDVIENEKLGNNKNTVAINFTFLDEEKTLTDKQIDAMMQTLMQAFEQEAQALIRK